MDERFHVPTFVWRQPRIAAYYANLRDCTPSNECGPLPLFSSRWWRLVALIVATVRSLVQRKRRFPTAFVLTRIVEANPRLGLSSWNGRLLNVHSPMGHGKRRRKTPPNFVTVRYLLSLALIAQYVSDRQQQVTSEVVRCFAIGIFDPMIACVISELPVFEFSIAVLNNFRTNLSAEKIV